MYEHTARFSLMRMAIVLDVSQSGYYALINAGRMPGPRTLARQVRDRKVKEAFGKSMQRDGARCIQVELAENGDQHDVKMIAASMCRQSLVPKAARKFKVTTDSNHKRPIAPNLLEQDKTTGPNQKWAGDTRM